MKNRDKILISARRLFNEQGFVNVRLQHISDDTIISVGNIAYHFKNKEAIVGTIFEELSLKQKEVLIEYRHTPIFANIDRIFASIEELQLTYSFFFTDTIELKRTYPEIFNKVKQFFKWQVWLFEEIIRFNIARGAMQKGLDSQEIVFVARMIVQRMNTWRPFLLVWEEFLTEDLLKLSPYMWKILVPYMTEIGKEEYLTLVKQTVSFVDREDQK